MNVNAVKCGSLVIVALSCCGLTPAPVRIDVTMTDYSFVPDYLTFEQGVNYRLHLENHGNDTHEFTAPVIFGTTGIGNPEALNRERSEVVVQPGDSKDVFLTPHSPGTYACAVAITIGPEWSAGSSCVDRRQIEFMRALLTSMLLARRASCRKVRRETGMARARRGFATGFRA